jgi:hypothetical protein
MGYGWELFFFLFLWYSYTLCPEHRYLKDSRNRGAFIGNDVEEGYAGI